MSFALVSVEASKAAPIIWTGPTITFSRIGFDPNPAANYDRLTNNVGLTRGNTAGMFNVFQENLFNAAQNSPRGTEWATDLLAANAGKTIAATNWQGLAFTSWTTAYGGSGMLNTNILAKNAVVHLIQDDIYLDLQFTQFGTGGAFAYQRSTPVPEPTGAVVALTAIGLLLLRFRKGNAGRSSTA